MIELVSFLTDHRGPKLLVKGGNRNAWSAAQDDAGAAYHAE
jgi:hypothetical protein